MNIVSLMMFDAIVSMYRSMVTALKMVVDCSSEFAAERWPNLSVNFTIQQLTVCSLSQWSSNKLTNNAEIMMLHFYDSVCVVNLAARSERLRVRHMERRVNRSI